MGEKYNVKLRPSLGQTYLGTMRVQGPDEALQCGIGSDKRRWMGDCSSERMTNVYARNKREILTQIWR